MPNFFYTDATGNKQGPLTPQQLQALATRGTITPTTPLETDTGHKGLAGKVPGLNWETVTSTPFAQTAQATPQSVGIPIKDYVARVKNAPLSTIAGAVIGIFVVLAWVSISNSGYFDNPSSTVKRFFVALDNIDGKTVIKVTTPDVFEELQSRGVINKNDNGAWIAPYHVSRLVIQIKSYSHTIDGDTAEVKVDFGPGLVPTVSLVKVDGKWKISDLGGLRELPSIKKLGN